MAGHDRQGRRQRAVRHRNAGVGGHGHGGGDTRHHFEIDPGGGHGFGLLPAAAEDEGIAALQTHHHLAGFRPFDQQAIDVRLILVLPASPAADVDPLRPVRRMPQQRGIREVIVQDDIGLLKTGLAFHRQQTRVSRTGTDEIDFAPTADVHDAVP